MPVTFTMHSALQFVFEGRELRTPNLQVCSQTRCRCAIPPVDAFPHTCTNTHAHTHAHTHMHMHMHMHMHAHMHMHMHIHMHTNTITHIPSMRERHVFEIDTQE